MCSWSIIGNDITKASLNFFSSGKLLKEICSTVIHLIPKGDNPSSPVEFRHISCCSILYKIISKMFCERLKMVLPKLISSSQSAVVEGRLLADNVLLCQELICGYERKMISPRCMMKMDIRKAYDSVQWSFLHKLLVSFGLPEVFVD